MIYILLILGMPIFNIIIGVLMCFYDELEYSELLDAMDGSIHQRAFILIAFQLWPIVLILMLLDKCKARKNT